jgi:hypothetical protein
MEVGQVLDDRFRITDVISRSGMAVDLQGARSAERRRRGGEGPVHAVRERSGLFLAISARGESIGRTLDHPYILHIMPRRGKEPAVYRDGASWARRCGR